MSKSVVAVFKRPGWAKELDDREFAFVSSYLGHFNATRAALEANIPKPSAHAQGWMIKNRPHVREAIDAGLREKMPALKLSFAERLAAIAEADHADYFQLVEKRVRAQDPNGKKGAKRTFTHTVMQLTPTAKLTERQRAAVKGIKQRIGLYGTTIEIQLHDPVAAIEKAGALLGLNHEQKQASIGNVTFVIETPDGTTMKTVAGPTSPIDRDAIDAQIAADAEPVEDLPPGARPQSKLQIETP